ncbi:MAG: dephospho-CoA kinase [Candidatus Eisenbacteria bacterium]|nr:dephospho-CoA kinase [Candidatus Eisenbacteria bacterium]
MIVAVTGNTGAGKTSVAELFALWGKGRRIDADRIGREVWEEDEAVRRRIAGALGPEVTGPDGEVDRFLLGRAVFGDGEKRLAFDRIVQPLLRERIIAEIEKARGGEERLVVLDAAFLFEWSLQERVDRIVTVIARQETRARRVAERHRVSLEEAIRRVESQESESSKAAKADFVIENNGDRSELEWKARRVWDAIAPGPSRCARRDAE